MGSLMNPRDFTAKYLGRDFGGAVDLFLILDDPKRSYKIPFPYDSGIGAIRYYVTRPEIEAIQLFANPVWRSQYQTYKAKEHSGGPKSKKPSAFFKESAVSGGLGIRNIKQYAYVHELWEDNLDGLIHAINQVKKEMRRSTPLKQANNRFYLADLLRPELIE